MLYPHTTDVQSVRKYCRIWWVVFPNHLPDTPFLKRQQKVYPMNISQETIDEILSVHESLWEAVYSTDNSRPSISYKGNTYHIQLPPHKAYASVLLPNGTGTNFLWVTQNMRKSSYGTMAIERALKRNEDHRISWILDTSNGGFTTRTCISTTRNSSLDLIDGQIEIYDSLGKETIWSHNKLLVTGKAQF